MAISHNIIRCDQSNYQEYKDLITELNEFNLADNIQSGNYVCYLYQEKKEHQLIEAKDGLKASEIPCYLLGRIIKKSKAADSKEQEEKQHQLSYSFTHIPSHVYKESQKKALVAKAQGVQDVLARIKVKCLQKYIAERSYINPTEEKKIEQAEYLTCFGRYSKMEKTQATDKVIKKLNHDNITAWTSREKAVLHDGKLGTLLIDLGGIDIPQPTGICTWFSQFCGSRPKPVDTAALSTRILPHR